MSSPARLRDDVGQQRMNPAEHVQADPDALVTRHGRRAVAVIAVVAALVITAVAFYRWGSYGTAAPLPAARASASASASASKSPTAAQIYTTVAPSMVSIEAQRPDPTEPDVSGTGIIVNADGTILTALHVVNNATAIQVTFADGTTSAAIVSAAAPSSDIATLAPATLPSVVVPAVLGNAGRLAVGDNVIAIGDQLGLTRTTTEGVVSGLNRQAPGPEGGTLQGLVQFDAAVNPGSSGGPLLNDQGQTVGIVVALANPTTAGTFIGIGFAVPIGAALAAGGGSRAPQQ